MSIRILTKNAVDNTNIDGARQNHFNAGMQSGIVKGALNEGKFFAITSNEIALDTCELRLCGHQVVIDDLQALTLLNKPTQPTKYSMIAEISVSDVSVPTFKLFIQPQNTPLIQDNLFKTISGKGTYQLRIGNFTLGTTGLISDVVRTADIITGGGEGASIEVEFNATAEQLSSSSKPEAHIDYNEETGKYDMFFGIPAGEGTNVSLGDVVLPEWKADFAESERQKSKNLLTLRDDTLEVAGVSITHNSKDQTITFNGTATSLSENYIGFIDELNLLQGKTYTLSATVISGSGQKFLYLYNTGTGLFTNIFGTNLTARPETLTLDKNIKYNALRWYVESGWVFNNLVIKLQLEENNQATNWQYPYGKIAHEKDILKDFWSGMTENNTWVELEIGTDINLINEYGFQGRYSRNIEKTDNGLVIKKTGYYFVDFNTSIERLDTTLVNVYIQVKKNDFVNMARQCNRTGDNLKELVASSGIIFCNSGDIITLNLTRDNANATGKIINLNFTIKEV